MYVYASDTQEFRIRAETKQYIKYKPRLTGNAKHTGVANKSSRFNVPISYMNLFNQAKYKYVAVL